MTKILTRRAEPLDLDEAIDDIHGYGPSETKTAGAPVRRAAASDGNAELKGAVIAMGKEVLKIGETVAEMKTAQPRRAADIEMRRRGAAEAKARRIAQIKADRPPGLAFARWPGDGPPEGRSSMRRVLKAATNHWLRTGSESFQGHHIADLQRKAGLFTESGPAGGYLVMPERGSMIDSMLTDISIMRQIATVQAISSGELVRPVNRKGTAGGWVSERAARPETAAPQLGEDRFPVFEVYAEPAATRALLDDAMIDVETWLSGEVVEKIAVEESDAFVNGDGITMPKGLLSYDFVTNHDQWEHGKFRLIETGVSGGFLPTAPGASPPTNPMDVLIRMVYAVKSGHRARCSWLMNSATAGVLRQLRDNNGQPLWREGRTGTTEAQPPTLYGYPVYTDEFMPDIGADTIAVGFGDWQRTYLIVDRLGVRVIRDEISNKPYTLFYTTKRVGGGVQYFDAAVFLKFGT